jgi:two-component system sensor histidine kinase YesM
MGYFLNEYKKSYVTQVAAADSQILYQLAYNLDIYLDEIYRLTLLPYYNRAVLEELRNDYVSTLAEKHRKRYIIENYLINTFISPRKDIQRAVIISDGLYFSEWNTSSIMTYEEQIQTDWYATVLKEKAPLIIMPEPDEKDGNSTFSLANAILDVDIDFSVLGVIKVDANYSTIRNLCAEVSMGDGGGVLLLSDGNVVYSSVSPQFETEALEDAGRFGYELPPGYMANNLMLNSISLDHFGWKLISVNTLDVMNGHMANMYRTILIGVCVTLIVTSGLLYITMSRYLMPLFEIIALMKKAKNDIYSVRYSMRSYGEFDYLGHAFNNMLDNLAEMYHKNEELTKNIYEAHIFRREAELLLLYSQIRPHFIYNTLNMISIQIQMEQYEQAVDGINKLSLFMRGIAYINKEIPLCTEISIVDSYLSIQCTRYGDKLRYIIDVDPSLKNYTIPSLILQPIAENAVLHCCKDKDKKITLRIGSLVLDKMLFINVEDDGNGIEPEKLLEIDRKMNTTMKNDKTLVGDISSAHGLGLVNVNQRLKMRFGEKYGLRINSVLGGGTVVSICLPKEVNKQ